MWVCMWVGISSLSECSTIIGYLQYKKILAMRSNFVQCQWHLLGNKTSFRCSVIVSTCLKNTNNLFALIHYK